MEMSLGDVIYLVVLVFLYVFAFVSSNIVLLILSGFLLGMWFVWKPPELAVEGAKSIGARFGLSAYWAGVISSFMSNVPEIFIVGLAFYRGYFTGNLELLELTVLIILVTIGWNIILLGNSIIIATRRSGSVQVPEEAISTDMELYRFTTIVLLVLIFYLILEAGFSAGGVAYIPRQYSLLMLLVYPIYLLSSREKVVKPVESHIEPKKGLILLILGGLGAYIGAELIVRSAELSLESAYVKELFGEHELVFTALIIGLLAAIPEHTIAVRAAYRGEVKISLGNLLGGLTQIILLILGGVGVFYPIPIDKYGAFQLASVALIMWFVKRSILDDGKLDLFEGLMIILLQVIGFTLLVS